MSARTMALEALKDLVARAKDAKTFMDKDIAEGEQVYTVSSRLTAGMATALQAIAALEAEMARAVEPVGWLKAHNGVDGRTLYSFTTNKQHVVAWAASGIVLTPVYTAPMNAELLAELKNIANANPKNWDAPYNDSASFQGWAQSRARAAIAKATGGAA